MPNATLAIQQTFWNGLSNRDVEVLKVFGVVLDLGVGAPWSAPEPLAPDWLVFADGRYDLEDTAYFGCMYSNRQSWANYVLPLDDEGNVDRDQVRSDQRDFCDNQFALPRRVQWPVEIADDDPNPFQTVLSAQTGIPDTVRMFTGPPPADWSPQEGDG